MNKKTWTTQADNFHIIVTNSWDWEGNTEEEIVINGKQEYYYSSTLISGENKARIGLSFSKKINEQVVTILCGSAWHFFGIGCKILINGKRVGGDKIVWFAK